MNSQPIGILFLITQFEVGGAQKVIMELYKRVDRSKFNPFLGVLYDKNGLKSNSEKLQNVQIFDFELKKPGLSPFFKGYQAFLGLYNLYRFLKSNNVSVIQSFSHFSNILGPIVATIAGVKRRITSQRMSLNHLPRTIQSLDAFIENSFLVHKLISVSEGTKKSCIEVQNIKPGKIITIPNAIDYKKFDEGLASSNPASLKERYQVPSGKIIFGTLARLHRQKGHIYLIEAIRKIAPVQPDIYFLFFGEGDLKSELQAKIQEYHLQKHIQIVPPTSDIHSAYASLDAFVLPSLWEGFPNTVLEAMTSSLPVIATAVDGAPEAVEDNLTGFLVPPRNPNALAEKISILAKSTNLRKSMGAAGRQRIEKDFDIKKMISRFESVYLDT